MRSRAGRSVHVKTPPEQLRQAGLLLDAAVARRAMDLPGIFGNRRPVEIEIGSGKGAFLLRRAAARPEINLLGIEWVRTYALYAADRAFRAGLGNVRLLCADAEQVIKAALSDQSVWRLHIYFPDPWPKRRQQRRRLIKPDFAAHARRVLRLGGWLGVVTDHADYFEQIRRVVLGTPGMMILPFVSDDPAQGVVGTNFERKYTGRRSFHTIAAMRYL